MTLVRRLVSRLRGTLGTLRLTGRGWALLVTAVVCFVAAPIASLPALLFVTALLVGLLGGASVLTLVGQADVGVRRSFEPEVLTQGETATASLHITNGSRFSTLEATWFDQVPRGLRAAATGRLPVLAPTGTQGSVVEVRYRLHGLRRGRHVLGPLRLEIRDPFGVVVRRVGRVEQHPVVVLPRRVELWPLAPRGADHDGASKPSPQNVGVGEDDIIARSYLPGDSMKRMHWKATAHRGELMVRQEEQQVNPRAAVVIDPDARSWGLEPDRRGEWDESPSLEWGIVAAASVSTHLVRIGYSVTTVVPGGPVRSLDEHGATLDDALLDLAELRPVADDTLLDADPGERTVFVVLGHLDVARATRWIEALRHATTVLAFVEDGSSSASLDALSAARWRVVKYRSGDDVAERWTDLDGSRALAAP